MLTTSKFSRSAHSEKRSPLLHLEAATICPTNGGTLETTLSTMPIQDGIPTPISRSICMSELRARMAKNDYARKAFALFIVVKKIRLTGSQTGSRIPQMSTRLNHPKSISPRNQRFPLTGCLLAGGTFFKGNSAETHTLSIPRYATHSPYAIPYILSAIGIRAFLCVWGPLWS